MKSFFVFTLIFAVVHCSTKQNKYEELIRRISKSHFFQKSFESNLKIYGGKHVGSTFPCQALSPSPTVPTSVHKLRPGDIKVVAALGDSLTAGNGITAKTIFGVLREDRGLSFSIGGDKTFEDAITIPNILKKYNPTVTGFSIKSGKVSDKNARLNVAEPGNVFKDLTDEASNLIARIKADTSIDINNDWKLVTILIGDNDLCAICEEDGKEAERYAELMKKTLDLLQKNLPRTIVNIVEVLNVDIIRKTNKGLICTVIHFALCKCAAFPKNDKAKQELRNMIRKYQTVIHDLATSGRYDTTDDFTVVDQPFFRDTYLPRKPGTYEPDLSYFAPDCFHLSEKGHSCAATALWNNMFEPVFNKSTEWYLGENIICPTEESPFIFTNKNSVSSRS